MDLSPRMKSLRGFGKAALAVTLVLLLFISAMAAGSSELHRKVHSDHGSPTHACLASTLENGHGEGPVATCAVFTSLVVVIRAHVPAVAAPITVQTQVFSGRGPPCLS